MDGFEPATYKEQYESDTLCPSERLQVTERVDVPPPQDAEHDDHEPVVYEYVYVEAQYLGPATYEALYCLPPSENFNPHHLSSPFRESPSYHVHVLQASSFWHSAWHSFALVVDMPRRSFPP